MRHAALVFLAIAAIGCGRSDSDEELGPIAFNVPSGWQRSDSHGKRMATAIFTPSSNNRKESITVIRTEVGPVATKYTPEVLSRLLHGAQSALAQARVSPVARLTTEHGFSGMQLEVDYVPPGLHVSYHRVHVTLTDGEALIHVLYTAEKPDPELVDLKRVIGSLREES